MNIKIIIREIQNLQEERDLYYSRSIEVDNRRQELEKLVSQQQEECETLKKQNSELESTLNRVQKCCIKLETDVGYLTEGLSEKNAEIKKYEKIKLSMQKKNDELQRSLEFSRRILAKKREQVTAVERESKQKDELINVLKNQIEISKKGEGNTMSFNNSVDKVVVQAIAKADQLNGLLESGSQVIHTNNK